MYCMYVCRFIMAKRTLGRRNFKTQVAGGASTLRRFHYARHLNMVEEYSIQNTMKAWKCNYGDRFRDKFGEHLQSAISGIISEMISKITPEVQFCRSFRTIENFHGSPQKCTSEMNSEMSLKMISDMHLEMISEFISEIVSKFISEIALPSLRTILSIGNHGYCTQCPIQHLTL